MQRSTPESLTPEAQWLDAPAVTNRPASRSATPWRRQLWHRFISLLFENLGWLLAGGTILVAVLAPWLAPFDPWRSVAASFQPPGAAHPFGTDDLGRDVLSGVIYATRTSLLVSLVATALSGAMGNLLGALSGYFGGLYDDILMRFTEFFQILPRFFLALIAVALFQPGLLTITLVLGLTSWPMTARLMRGQILAGREREYVVAARSLGGSSHYILWRHVIPNALAPIIVHTSLLVGQFMLIEASLAFLGLGDANHMSWGYLLRNAQPFLRVAWWMSLFPGLAIALAVLGFNLLGDQVNNNRLPMRGAVKQ